MRPGSQAEGNAVGKVTLEPITPEVMRKAEERAAAVANAPTAILHADVGAMDGTLYLRLLFRDGSRLFVPTSRIEEIADAKPEALEHLEVSPARDAISFPALDVDMYVPGLLSDLYGTKILAEQGQIGGKRSSSAKTKAVRENGKKGGRPNEEGKRDRRSGHPTAT
jgi:hypothetical protein